MNGEWCLESSDHCIICSGSPRKSAPVTDSCLLALSVQTPMRARQPPNAHLVHDSVIGYLWTKTCKLKNFLEKFQQLSCCRWLLRLLCNSDLIGSCCYRFFPMAVHWPVIAAGGKAGAPWFVNWCALLYWYHSLQVLCCLFGQHLLSTQLPLALPVPVDLYPMVGTWSCQPKQDFKIMPHPGSNASDSIRMILIW